VRSPALTANGIMMSHRVCCFCIRKLAPQRFPTHGTAVTVASGCMHRTDKLRLHSHHYAAQSFEFSLMPTGYTWGEHPQIPHHSYPVWCHCALMPLPPRRCCRCPASPWQLMPMGGTPPRTRRTRSPRTRTVVGGEVEEDDEPGNEHLAPNRANRANCTGATPIGSARKGMSTMRQHGHRSGSQGPFHQCTGSLQVTAANWSMVAARRRGVTG
jgi:hypothetical protein